MKDKEKGAISVEACIILFIFMFGMLALLGMINMVRGQIIVQNTLNQTAKEVSQYSYIVYRMGYLDYLRATNENKAEFDKKIAQYSDTSKMQENLIGLMKQFSDDGGQSFLDDMVKGLFGKASTMVTDEANKQIIKAMAKNSIEEYAKSLGNGEDYFKRIGIVDGINGITKDIQVDYCKDAKHEIVICVEYKLEYKFPFIDISFDVPIRLSTVTTAWAGGVKK